MLHEMCNLYSSINRQRGTKSITEISVRIVLQIYRRKGMGHLRISLRCSIKTRENQSN